MSGTFWGFKTGKDAAGLGKGQTPYNVWDSPPCRPLPHSRELPRPSGPRAEGERCRPGPPLRCLTRSSSHQTEAGRPEESKWRALDHTALCFQSLSACRQTQKLAPFLCGPEMSPTNAGTLQPPRAPSFRPLQKNMGQALGWSPAGKKKKYRTWNEIFVQIFFLIFFPNLNFIYRKGRE